MKHVYIFNRSASSNIGDQLIGFVLSTILTRVGYQTRVNRVYHSGGFLGSLRSHLCSYGADIWEVARCEFLVIGGGNLIMDVSFGPRWAFHHFWLSLLCLLFRKDYYYISVGVAPLRHRASRLLYRFALQRATKVSVRDSFSQQYVQDLAPGKQVHLIPDPALAISTICSKRKHLTNKKVGICPIRLYPTISNDAEMHHDYVELHVDLIKHFLAEGKEVHLFLNENVMDVQILNDILDKFPILPRRLKITERFQDLDEYLEFISSLDLVISSRMHGVIPAISYGIPGIGLGWQPKMKYLFSDLALPGHVDILDSLAIRGTAQTYQEIVQMAEELCGEIAAPKRSYQVEDRIIEFLNLFVQQLSVN